MKVNLPDLTEREIKLFKKILRIIRNKDSASNTTNGLIPIRKYVNLKEASKHFAISIRTLYRMRENNVVKFYKIGGRTLLKLKELEQIIYEDRQKKHN